MVAIDMEMPNACTSTQETLGDIEVANCPLYNVCKHRDTIRTNYKPTDCPLVEIVTCKDCEDWMRDMPSRVIDIKEYHFCPMVGFNTAEDYFCPDGERRE